MSVVEAYRRLIGNRPLTRLLLGEFVSDVGDWLYLVALMVVVYQVSGDPLVLGVIGAVRVLPYVLLSIPAGMVADRFDRRSVLIVSDVVRCLAMLALAGLAVVGGPVWAMVVLAVVTTCVATFFYPAIGALVPSLVRDESEFGPANGLYASLLGLSHVVGPALGGLLVATGGLAVAFVLNALTFAVAALVVRSLPPSKARSMATAAPGLAGAADVRAADVGAIDIGATYVQTTDVRAADIGATDVGSTDVGGWSGADLAPEASPGPGSVVMARDGLVAPDPGAGAAPDRPLPVRPMAGVMVIDMAASFVTYGLMLMFVILAADVYRGGDAAVGYLNAALGVGALVGSAAAGVLTLRRTLRAPIVAGSFGVGVATALMGVAPGLAAGVLFAAMVAGSSAILEVSYTTVFQRLVPDEFRGRATGVMSTTGMLAGAVGSFLLPTLYGLIGIAALLAVSGAIVIVGGLAGVTLVGTEGTRMPGPFETQLRRARGLPVFGGLDPARLELALDRLVPARVPPGEAIVRQGELADRFYIVSEGHVTVSAAGRDRIERRLRRLGPDDVFGEIGLLTNAPRSATVTADDQVLVLALDGRTFVELVTSGPGAVSRFLGLYQAPMEGRPDVGRAGPPSAAGRAGSGGGAASGGGAGSGATR